MSNYRNSKDVKLFTGTCESELSKISGWRGFDKLGSAQINRLHLFRGDKIAFAQSQSSKSSGSRENQAAATEPFRHFRPDQMLSRGLAFPHFFQTDEEQGFEL